MSHRHPLLSACAALLIFTASCTTPTPAPTATPTLPPTTTPLPPPTIVAPTVTPVPTATPYQPVWIERACPFDLPAEVKVDCGVVKVLETRDGAATRTIQLQVAVYHRQRADAPTDPVVFLQGGPGSPAVEALNRDYYTTFIAPLTTEFDVIVFDPRGTGGSTPALDCSEIKLLYLQLLGATASPAETETQYTEAFRRCHQRLRQQGIDLAAYHSRASAADVLDILRVLGYQRANVYATSYGTRVAQVLLRDAPEWLHAVVLDSPVPLNAPTVLGGAQRRTAAVHKLLAGCAQDAVCHAAYPTLPTVYSTLLTRLQTAPLTLTIPASDYHAAYDTQLSAAAVDNLLLWGLFFPSIIGSLPKAINDLNAGQYDTVRAIADLPLLVYQTVSLGVWFSTECTEQVYAATPAALQADFDAETGGGELSATSFFGRAESQFAMCAEWGAAAYDERDREPVTATVPTLIFSGEYDPVTPLVYAETVAAGLSQSEIYTFTGASHVPGLAPAADCFQPLLREFLASATHPTAAPCLNEFANIKFFVPAKAGVEIPMQSAADAENQWSGLLPAGWQAANYGFWYRSAYYGDPTAIAVQSGPVTTTAWVEWLTVNFAGGAGFDAPPQAAGQRQIAGRTWLLYATTFQNAPVDLAYLETPDRTWLVLFLSTPAEHTPLYKAVFLRVLEALVPGS